MTNYPWAGIEEFRDIESVNHFAAAVAAGQPAEEVLTALRAKSRDNARTPMQWDASPQAGFTTGTPWLPVNPDHVRVNAAAQAGDPDSVLAHYRRLIELRHTVPAVAHGDFTMLLPEDERVYAFTRAHQGVELLVLCNVSAAAAAVDVPGWDAAELLLGTHGTGGTGELAPWESRVLRRPA
jgi:oligo-1,6-glucosidase